MPDNVKYVDNSAFYGSGLQELYIGNAINHIGMKAFPFIPVVYLINSITTVTDFAFEDAEDLTYIHIPNTVKEIESNAFAFCGNLQGVYIDDLANWCEIKFGNEYANPTSRAGELWVNGGHLTYLEIPEGVKSIGAYAFYGCYYIFELKIPDTVEKIGEYAFFGCNRLGTLRIGRGLRYIGQWGIRANSVSTIYIESIEDFCQMDMEQYIFNQWGTTELICNGKLVTKIDLTDKVSHIGACIFENYTKLASISMTDAVTSVGREAFFCCSGLIKAELSNSIVSIPDNCFGGTSNLSKFNFPSGLSKIGDYAFESTGLKSVKLPMTVNDIGVSAFSACKADSIFLSDRVTHLQGSTFAYCENLKYIYLGNSMEVVTLSDFRDCPNLKVLELPSSMHSLGVDSENSFTEFYCYSSIPYNATFTPMCVQDITLFVPKGCRDNFIATYPWNGFKEIIEMEWCDGIEVVKLDNLFNDISIFSCGGAFLGQAVSDLTPGIYILRYNNQSKKILVR